MEYIHVGQFTDAEAQVMSTLAKAQREKDERESLGVKARTINEAQGAAEAIRLKAEAERIRIVQEAKVSSMHVVAVS